MPFLSKPCCSHERSQRITPSRAGKFNRGRYIRIPTLANHQKALPPCSRLSKRPKEIIEQNDVAIRVAQVSVTCNGLRPLEHVIQIFHSACVTLYVWLMTQA